MSVSDSNETTQYDSLATLGGGCFWCVEAVFEGMQGVGPVVSGYAGGDTSNPSYRDVCTGSTGHAEVCQIHFDSAQVSFEQLLEVFFRTHDPTTLNRQGHDVGTQYRSTIMYHDEEQKQTAERIIASLNSSGAYSDPIVTEVVAAPTFYEAEEEHQDYYRRNPGAGYCVAVVAPKVEKFRQAFPKQRK